MFSKFFILLGIIVSLGVFVYTSDINYAQHVRIKRTLVDHPEFIPTSQIAKLSSGGFENIIADFYWLSAVQYIGSNALWSEYKAYLYVILNLITDLNPYFTFPYQIGEILLPSYNERYEGLSSSEIQKNTDQAIRIGLKGVQNNCNLMKVERAKNENNLSKLWTDESYKNACSDPMIPYYLAYIYYWNLHDGVKSSEYYRIAATNDDAPTGARTLAAIMQGKSWNREKAIIMFLSLAENIDVSKQNICQQFSHELWKSLLNVFSGNVKLTGKELKSIEWARQSIISKFEKLSENHETDESIENLCSPYLNKAVRELNLAYLEEADDRYFNDKKIHASTSSILFQEKYIDYEPLDYQRDEKEQQGIEYYYNIENQNWDYRMWLLR